ncbi:YolD-like family protein [Bacillus swezeyi]|uniref:YolD-like family protein n=1 Tax=Bacillus swezeyi TaxID=1925020 RepID=A0A5M8RJC6_9BACI|nr:YolD-like family protein [Bacillus swezeyi]KAA6446966.1 YolD-like family protein [Bacillus swezeyi]KAA6471534.1 YolD-like family protein [Bacillus swezeyi]
MLRDRGSIKWVSMMLPEHVELLKEYHESLDKVKKPVLDEQNYEELNEMICAAMEENKPLQFSFYQRGKIKELTGHIHYVDALKQELRIKSLSDEKHIIQLDDIVGIK